MERKLKVGERTDGDTKNRRMVSKTHKKKQISQKYTPAASTYLMNRGLCRNVWKIQFMKQVWPMFTSPRRPRRGPGMRYSAIGSRL